MRCCCSAPLRLGRDKPFQVISTVDATDHRGPAGPTGCRGQTASLAHARRHRVLLQLSLPHAVDHSLGSVQPPALPTTFFCCFDFDRTTFEMQPDWHWANSTAYLRAMMQGFIERLYPYTGDPNTITFLQDFIDYELENGLTPEKLRLGAGALYFRQSGRPPLHRLEPARRGLPRAARGRRGRLRLPASLRDDRQHQISAGRHSVRRRAGEELQDRRRAEFALAGALLCPRWQGRRAAAWARTPRMWSSPSCYSTS